MFRPNWAIFRLEYSIWGKLSIDLNVGGKGWGTRSRLSIVNLSIKFKFHWRLSTVMPVLHEDRCTLWLYLAEVFLEWQMLQTEAAEKIKAHFDAEYIYGFVWWGSASKVDDVTALPSRAVTRWRICVTMATLWQQEDGGYALLWKLCDILHLQQYSHRLNFLYVFFTFNTGLFISPWNV